MSATTEGNDHTAPSLYYSKSVYKKRLVFQHIYKEPRLVLSIWITESDQL